MKSLLRICTACSVVVVLHSCNMMGRVEAPTDIHLEQVPGKGAFVSWVTKGASVRCKVALIPKRGGQPIEADAAAGTSHVWLDAMPGIYEVQVTALGEQNQPVATKEAKLVEPPPRLSFPDKATLGIDHDLGIQCILVIAGREQMNSQRVKDDLETVALHLATHYLGRTYVVDREQDVLAVQNKRTSVMTQEDEPLPLFGSHAALIVDLRLKRGDVPAQLALRLYDISKDHFDADYTFFHRRPLVYEDFIELDYEAPHVTSSDVDRDKGRRALVAAVKQGLEHMIADRLVNRYANEIKKTHATGVFYREQIYHVLGCDISPAWLKNQESSVWVEENVLFPSVSVVSPAGDSKNTTPKQITPEKITPKKK